MQKEIISIATTNPISLHPTDKMSDAVKLMSKKGFRRIPIVHDMFLVGILTATDVLRALNSGNTKVLEAPIAEFMTEEPIAVYRSADLTAAIDLMFQHNLGSLPIVSEGTDTLAGIVTERDLVRHFSEVADADLSEFVEMDPVTLDFNKTTIDQLIAAMVEANMRRAILIDKKKNVKGMVTSTDVLRYVSNEIIRRGELSNEIFSGYAKDIAIVDVKTVNINSSMAEVAKMLSDKGMGGVPVTNDDGELLGIFTERDLLRVVALFRLM